MSDEPAGYDFFYESEVRAMLPSLTEQLKKELKQAERELLRDQSEANPRIRY